LNNHITFYISFFRDEKTDTYSIVGTRAIASSVEHTANSCDGKAPLPKTLKKLHLKNLKGVQVPWSYSVYWIESKIKWASRWDAYLNIGETSVENKIHWFSIVNSLMILFFLTGMVAMILMRALHKDITAFNQEEDEDDITDESGWKHVHGDVFRKPFASTLLSITLGTGTQILGMSVITIIFSILGFLSPSNRGGIFSIMLLFFVLLGYFTK
jgi:transmembrane 9 superfamily member 2/4